MLTDYSEIRKIHKKKFSEQERAWCQFFSDEALATFMASFIKLNKEENQTIRILDAGAGDAILAYAAVQRCLDLGYKNIEVCLYEIDKDLIKLIDSNFKFLLKKLSKTQTRLKYHIFNKDFLNFDPKQINSFDIAIINPPFKKTRSSKQDTVAQNEVLQSCEQKINKTSLYTNHYVDFMSLCLDYLNHSGQLISITPRSFTSGAYFKNFRNKLLKESNLEAMHLFSSRKSIFKSNSIYQENIICKFIKGVKQNSLISLSCSADMDFNKSFTQKKLPNKLLIKSLVNDNFIFIPENNAQAKAIKELQKFEDGFDNLALSINTGPVVPFRAKGLLSKVKHKNSIPLLGLNNVEMLAVNWSEYNKNDWAILPNTQEKLKLVKKSSIVLLRRFAPKDSPKRIIAAVINPEDFNSDFLGIENHLNLISKNDREFTKYEAYGLAAFLNSSLVDNYFRALSGSTQINKNELLTLRLPSLKQLSQLGKKLLKKDEGFNQNIIDEFLGCL
jgi:adenine-specific DNA-methyltransferase